MLIHPTLDLLHGLGLHGMAEGYKSLDANPEAAALSHAEWLGIILDHEKTLRAQKRFESRARAARLRHPASVEDVDYRAHRGLDRALFLKLAGCDWIRSRHNLVITGPCGVGKSWLACALGQKACREDLSVLYYRVPRLFAALGLARGDGRYAKLLKQLARARLLVLDDWGPEPLTAEQARDLLEIVEDRYDAGSVLITSQVPVDRWYEMIGMRSGGIDSIEARNAARTAEKVAAAKVVTFADAAEQFIASYEAGWGSRHRCCGTGGPWSVMA